MDALKPGPMRLAKLLSKGKAAPLHEPVKGIDAAYAGVNANTMVASKKYMRRM
jgi:hypothetical protein